MRDFGGINNWKHVQKNQVFVIKFWKKKQTIIYVNVTSTHTQFKWSHDSKFKTLLTVLVFLHYLHQVSGVQVELVFGRLDEVCDHSVGVQYDRAGNVWQVEHSNLI